MSEKRIYVAAPFFNPEQLALVKGIEELLTGLNIPFFSPRLAPAALKMNAMIANKETPPLSLKNEVFKDNYSNIDTAPVMIAVIDGRDTGVTWEMGYAFSALVPTLTFTNKNFGMNLMLAQCTVGHCKGIIQLREALVLLQGTDFSRDTIDAVIKPRFLTPDQLTEGTAEHSK